MKGVYVAASVSDLYNLAEKSLPPIDNHLKLVLYYRSAQQILLQVLFTVLFHSTHPSHTFYRQTFIKLKGVSVFCFVLFCLSFIIHPLFTLWTDFEKAYIHMMKYSMYDYVTS